MVLLAFYKASLQRDVSQDVQAHVGELVYPALGHCSVRTAIMKVQIVEEWLIYVINCPRADFIDCIVQLDNNVLGSTLLNLERSDVFKHLDDLLSGGLDQVGVVGKLLRNTQISCL